MFMLFFFFFQAEDGIRDHCVTGVQTCALPICGDALSIDARQRPQAAAGHALRQDPPGASRRRMERPRGRCAVLAVAVGGAVKTVLFVCHANTCRSVMAQALLEKMLAERNGRARVRVRSGGVGHSARDGMIPSLDARLLLREDGIHLTETAILSTDLRRHPEVVAAADLILTMTARQKLELAAVPESDGRPVFTLKEFVGEDGDIADPMGQDEDTYRACRDEIKRCLELSIDRLLVTIALDR